MLSEKWTCQNCGKENPASAWVCVCVKKDTCINHPQEKSIHQTPDGPMCNTCYDHFTKDDIDYESEYEE